MDFGEPSGGGFIDQHFDFARCQRADGSYYGTGGVCRQGTAAGAKEKEAKAAPKASSGGVTEKDLKAKTGEVVALDKAAKAADRKADAAEKAWRKGGAKPGAEQKEVRRLDKEAKAANKKADQSAKELKRMQDAKSKAAQAKAKMRAQDKKLEAAQAKVKEQLKTASPARAKALRAKRANLEEARTKLKYKMKGLGGGQSKLTGADVKRAVGTAD